LAPGREQRGDRRDRRREQADVVAERGAEAARLDEIALHVDDDECGARRREGVLERRRREAKRRHAASLRTRVGAAGAATAAVPWSPPPMWAPIVRRSAPCAGVSKTIRPSLMTAMRSES